MEWVRDLAINVVATTVFIVGAAFAGRWVYRRWRRSTLSDGLAKHFSPVPLDQLSISDRQFPFHVRVDLQRAIEQFVGESQHACWGVKNASPYGDCDFSAIFAENPVMPSKIVPVQYEHVDVGEDRPARCATSALWTVRGRDGAFALLYSPVFHFQGTSKVRVQIAAPADRAQALAEACFHQLELAIERATAYRGKILSFEQTSSYRGESRGITVHRLQTVGRDQVILPRKTVDLLDRNVLDFVARRPRLRELGMSTKKGLLFYGPPGTGKTHTIHYLAGALQGHTVLLISAEQVALLSEYMTLARLLQPSVVVLEDVDLIARERSDMESACEEVLLNKLLNEMDGLKEQADILFILTTNRPEALERAISSRPGRVDQAIEFPLPDDEGRAKLVRLYARGATIGDELVQAIVARTGQVSAAFIKELMRRTAQFHLERSGDGALELDDVDRALDEMLFAGGSLNLKLLGAEGRQCAADDSRLACP